MKSANHKRIFEQISRTPVNEVFLADLKNNLASYIGQRPIERKPAFTWSINRVAVGATVVVLCLTSSGLVYASQTSLPGTTLYPVKRATENIRLAVIISPSAKKDLEVKFINKRLEEVERLEIEPEKNNVVLKNALATVEKEIVKLESEEVRTPTLLAVQSTTSTTSALNNIKRFEEKIIEKPLIISRRNLDKLIQRHRTLEQAQPDKGTTTETQKIDNEIKNREKVEVINKNFERPEKKDINNDNAVKTRQERLEKNRATTTPILNKEQRSFRRELIEKIREMRTRENSINTRE